jgi:mono/diheme cytochrome c family protein
MMRALLAALLVVVIGATAALGYLKSTGLSARATPRPLEVSLARRARAWAVPSAYRDRTNPVSRSRDAVADGLAHFADHCAICHGNDGSGNTTVGKGLFPPAPDMRLAATQSLTDGELFYIIEHGVRFTGMPAWGTGRSDDEEASWRLVHFIRHLPQLTADELKQMDDLNPKSPDEVREQLEEEQFLKGSESRPAAPSTPHKHPGGTHD